MLHSLSLRCDPPWISSILLMLHLNKGLPNFSFTKLCYSHIHSTRSSLLSSYGGCSLIFSWKSDEHTLHGYILEKDWMNFRALSLWCCFGVSGYPKVNLCNIGHVDLPRSMAFKGLSLNSVCDILPLLEDPKGLFITSLSYFSSLSFEQM